MVNYVCLSFTPQRLLNLSGSTVKLNFGQLPRSIYCLSEYPYSRSRQTKAMLGHRQSSSLIFFKVVNSKLNGCGSVYKIFFTPWFCNVCFSTLLTHISGTIWVEKKFQSPLPQAFLLRRSVGKIREEVVQAVVCFYAMWLNETIYPI